jgi:excisionase family DNA binding protein
MHESASPPEALLFTFEEAARRLSMSESWLRKQVANRAIPHTKLGRSVRFTEDQLRRIIAIKSVEPVVRPLSTGRRRSAL